MLTYKNLGRLGRFANSLFEIAGTIGIAVKSGQNFGFPQFINYDAKERFGSTEDIDVYKYFVNQLPELPMEIPFHEYPYFWGYRDIRFPEGNWNMNAHFQSPKYFDHCIDIVRHYFTMWDEQKLSSTAVHLRFGDYDDSYHPRPKIEYYTAALNHIPEDSELLLFSDDNDLAERLLRQCTDRYFKTVNHNYLNSFICMKSCKHFVCGNSSYSMMAAILSDQPGKIITAPKKWFGDHVELETHDLYPENCIII